MFGGNGLDFLRVRVQLPVKTLFDLLRGCVRAYLASQQIQIVVGSVFKAGEPAGVGSAAPQRQETFGEPLIGGKNAGIHQTGMGFETGIPLFLAQILERSQFFLKDRLQIMGTGSIDKSAALFGNSVHTGVIHKNAQAGFLLFERQDFLKIAGEIAEQFQIIGDIL